MDSLKQTSSIQETMAHARDFAGLLRGGDIIRLHGDLGAGKTTWVKGLADGLGLSKKESVTSPTFSLMHRYSTRVPLYHFDCYRIQSPDELTQIGFEEFVHDRQAVICIEWPEKAGALVPAGGWDVTLRHCGDTGRTIEVKKA